MGADEWFVAVILLLSLCSWWVLSFSWKRTPPPEEVVPEFRLLRFFMMRIGSI